MVLNAATKQAAGKAEPETPAADPAFEGFLDVPFQLRAELGRRKLRCAEVIALQVGSVVALKRSAGENVTLLINGIRIGAGEIVVIEDTMGLRITDLGVRKTGKDS